MVAFVFYSDAMPRAVRPILDTAEDQGIIHGLPIPTSASLHSAWLLVENRVSEMKIK